MPSRITLELVDGVRVVVPDSLNLITTYVLSEQRDWFEDEIKFLRRVIQPGQKVVDIGANCGVYTLTMARLVGPGGQVLAFEPASATADLLAAGIAANGFTQVELIRSALSSAPGSAQLSVSEHSELNELVRGNQPKGATETVTLETLDDAMVKYQLSDIRFVKIDAEGEEANILRAGTRFLATQSPLIQFEIKAATMNLALVDRFAEHGYKSYRLVPGLGLLVPFDHAGMVDEFLLNLFCCKPDEAARLAERGLLVDTPADLAGRSDPLGWRSALGKLPYGALLADTWNRRTPDDDSAAVEQSLSDYVLSQEATASAPIRFAALTRSYEGFRRLCERQAKHLRLSSLARVALDYGARGLGVRALAGLYESLLQQAGRVDMSEPFLAPGARFDSISPGQAMPRWFAAAVLEELERNDSYSSYYTGKASQPRLEMIRDLGYASDEMKRRLALVQRKFGTAR